MSITCSTRPITAASASTTAAISANPAGSPSPFAPPSRGAAMGKTQAAPAVKRKGARTWRQRLDIAGRVVAAIFVGYLLASLATAVLARLLPGPTVEA